MQILARYELLPYEVAPLLSVKQTSEAETSLFAKKIGIIHCSLRVQSVGSLAPLTAYTHNFTSSDAEILQMSTGGTLLNGKVTILNQFNKKIRKSSELNKLLN